MGRKYKINKEERHCLHCGKETKNLKYCNQECFHNDPNVGKKHSEDMKIISNDPKFKENQRIKHVEMWKDIEYAEKQSKAIKEGRDKSGASEKQSETMTQLYIDHPEKRVTASNSAIKRFKDPEQRRLRSEQATEQFSNPEARELARQNSIKQFSDPENRETARNSANKRWENPEEHDKASKAMLKANAEHPEYGEFISQANKDYNAAHPEKGQKHSKVMKEKCKDPEFVRKTHHRNPVSSAEKKLIKMIEENQFPFYFNGNAQNEKPFLIGSRIPDFVHFTEKKIIETMGDYFHANPKIYKADDIVKGIKAGIIQRKDKERLKEIKIEGFQILVIWESEFKNRKKVITKINKFLEKNR